MTSPSLSDQLVAPHTHSVRKLLNVGAAVLAGVVGRLLRGRLRSSRWGEMILRTDDSGAEACLQWIVAFLGPREIAFLAPVARMFSKDSIWHPLCVRDVPVLVGEATWRGCYRRYFEERLVVEPWHGEDLRSVAVVLLGDSMAGKSALLLRLVESQYSEPLPVTLGADFMNLVVRFRGLRLRAQICDMPGLERLSFIPTMYLPQAHAAVLCFDVSARTSFEHLKGHLIRVRAAGRPPMSITIAALKCDLAEDGVPGAPERQALLEEARLFAEARGVAFVSASAKTGLRVEEVLATAIKRVDLLQLRHNPGGKTRRFQSPPDDSRCIVA